MIRLSDEEIWSELGIPQEERHLRICRGEFNAFKEGNEAQLKKVVEYLREYSFAMTDANPGDVQVPAETWQALFGEIK